MATRLGTVPLMSMSLMSAPDAPRNGAPVQLVHIPFYVLVAKFRECDLDKIQKMLGKDTPPGEEVNSDVE